MATETIDINPRDVIVKDRIRKDLGDTTTLMVSMEKEGQLQAIGIDSENNLIFGERRLDAAIRAGWETIRATRFDDKTDAAKAMAAEFAENTERKEFAPLELREAAKRLEASLKPAAIAKREENLKRGDAPPKKESPEKPKLATSGKSADKPPKSPAKTREIVAAAFGKSPETLRKIDVVAKAAEQPDAPAEVKAAAEEMNRTGKVDPAFKAVQAATNPPTHPVDPIADTRDNIRSTLKVVIRDVRKIPDIDHKAFIEHIGQAGKVLDGSLPPVQPNPTPDAVLTFPCAGKPASWVLTKAQVEEWVDLYQAVDVVAECKKALGWVRSNSKKTAKGMPRFLTSWLGRAQDGAKGAMAASGGRDKLTGLKAFVDSERRRGSQHHDVELIEGGGNETPF